MDELIEALKLLSKYEKPFYPTSCDDGVLYVWVSPDPFAFEELIQLSKLTFRVDDRRKCFSSRHFGMR